MLGNGIHRWYHTCMKLNEKNKGRKNMEKLLSAKDVSEILNCPVSTIYTFHQNGKLKGVKIGGLLRFTQEEVEKLIGRNSPQSKETDE